MPWLGIILAWALALRVAAAVAVERVVAGDREANPRGKLCLFDDADIYWQLARSIRAGGPYVVWQYDQPHYALRTPGYPLFLAACQSAFGPSTLAVRLVQAALGAVGVWVVYRLTRRIWPEDADRGWRSVPILAALIAATEPYSAAASALILSEGIFVPPMLAMLWGLAALWPSRDGTEPRHPWLVALGTGLAAGAGVLVRPSWALFVPLVLAAWVALAGRGRRLGALRGAALVALGLAVAMGPWWARNARVFGRFVPTALWAGASLYDGLRPDADGSSDMRFLDVPAIRALDETTQDRTLRGQALDFARGHPGRALELAAIKAARFWSPWPNADQFSSPRANMASAAAVVPLYLLLLAGAWDRRHDPRTLVLLAGPLLYFAGLHMVFVSSIRYRIPAAVPAFGLAAAGLAKWLGRGADRGR